MSGQIFQPGYFTGETIGWRVADLVLSEVRHDAPKDVAVHTHAAPYFSVLLEGSYSESAPDFAVAYEPYTLIFHAAATEHRDSIGAGGCRMFFIELLTRWSEVIEQLGGAPAHIFELRGGDPLWLALRLYREFQFRDEAAEAASIESLLYELCTYAAGMVEEPAREPEWLAGIEERLRSDFRSSVTIAALAAAAAVHPSHLCKTFRRFRRRSIGEYILGLRTQLVCRRLVEGDRSLSEVALEAGFADQSHMTRVFKRLTGSSPGAYRQRATGSPAER